jgi:hypothetical protein
MHNGGLRNTGEIFLHGIALQRASAVSQNRDSLPRATRASLLPACLLWCAQEDRRFRGAPLFLC